jgi:hypothetical protein
MVTDHVVTVVDEYRRASPWTARCSCGWEESYNAEIVAVRVAQEHEKRRSSSHARRPPAGGQEVENDV